MIFTSPGPLRSHLIKLFIDCPINLLKIGAVSVILWCLSVSTQQERNLLVTLYSMTSHCRFCGGI